MKKLFFILMITSSAVYSQNNSIQYPETKKGDVIDTYFDAKVNDPYRWLENDRSAETAEWVKAQNNVTFEYLNQIPYKKQIKERLEKILNYERISAPFKEGDFTYYYKNDGLQNQSVLYRKDKLGKEEVFLNPNTFSSDGTTSLANVSFSKNGNKVAYSISVAGSDWNSIIIMDAVSKKILEKPIKDVKFSGIAWQGELGFYYSSYDKPEGSELSAKTDHHKLYFHKLNTSQNQDEVVFGKAEKRRYVGGSLTEDERFLVITAANSTSGNELYIKDLSNPLSKIVTVLNDFNSTSNVIENVGSKLYIVTNLDAPNKRIVTVDASNASSINWIDFIKETENVLSPNTGAGFFFANYMKDAISYVTIRL